MYVKTKIIKFQDIFSEILEVRTLVYKNKEHMEVIVQTGSLIASTQWYLRNIVSDVSYYVSYFDHKYCTHAWMNFDMKSFVSIEYNWIEKINQQTEIAVQFCNANIVINIGRLLLFGEVFVYCDNICISIDGKGNWKMKNYIISND